MSWLVWVGLGCWWIFSIYLSPPAPASPGIFLAWQWQRSRRASGSTQDHVKPKFNISTPSFLLNPLIKANHKTEPKVKRWEVPSPTVDTTKVYGGRVGLRIGATDAIYQRPVKQAILFLPTVAGWFLFLFLSLTSDLHVSSLPSPDNHGNQMPPLGVVDTEHCFLSSVSVGSHSLCNCKLQRRNSIFKLLHHQVGHICEVTEFFFIWIPIYLPQSLFFLQ